MRHRKAKRTLDRNTAQRGRLLRNLAISLLTRERITTTAARGKAVRSLAERLITLGKHNDLHHRREIIRYIASPAVAVKLLETLGPRYAKRHGGYTRTIKVGPRAGDGAQEVIVELIKE